MSHHSICVRVRVNAWLGPSTQVLAAKNILTADNVSMDSLRKCQNQNWGGPYQARPLLVAHTRLDFLALRNAGAVI